MYTVGLSTGDTGRPRLAVFDDVSRVWYFPHGHGRAAAERLAATLNREAR